MVQAVQQTETMEQFTEKVKLFLQVHNWTSNRLAKSIGQSPATVSQMLSNQYPGDIEKIKGKIVNVMIREAEKSALKKSSTSFIETSVSKRYFDIAKACHLYGEIGVCYSDAGLGKTISGREYARRNSDAILIEVDPGYTAKYFLQELHAKLGLSNQKRHVMTLLSECISKLQGSGRFLIIDEAEQLPYKALETIRRINDKANVGILLTGMHKLLNNLRGAKDEFAQLFNRVGMAAKLEKLTEKDTQLIVASTIECDESLWSMLHKESNGITRRLYKIIARSMFIAQNNNRDIDEEVIKAAADLVKIERMS